MNVIKFLSPSKYVYLYLNAINGFFSHNRHCSRVNCIERTLVVVFYYLASLSLSLEHCRGRRRRRIAS